MKLAAVHPIQDVTMLEASRMATVGEIARRLDAPTHRIQYILRTRAIPPSGIAGNSRVYTEADVERIATELRAIEHRRGADSDAAG
jgi:MerR HTH family regulatory protein